MSLQQQTFRTQLLLSLPVLLADEGASLQVKAQVALAELPEDTCLAWLLLPEDTRKAVVLGRTAAAAGGAAGSAGKGTTATGSKIVVRKEIVVKVDGAEAPMEYKAHLYNNKLHGFSLKHALTAKGLFLELVDGALPAYDPQGYTLHEVKKDEVTVVVIKQPRPGGGTPATGVPKMPTPVDDIVDVYMACVRCLRGKGLLRRGHAHVKAH